MKEKLINHIKRDYLKIEFTSLEEIGNVIIQSPIFILDTEIVLNVSKENFTKFIEILIQHIEAIPQHTLLDSIPLDKFFLPQHPKQIIKVCPKWFPDYLNKYESILEIR